MHLTDLTAARAAILGRHTSAQACLETSLEAANSAAARCAFISLSPEVAREQARFVDAALARGTDPGRAAVLAGLAVSVKDLYDVAGERTLAASRVLDDRAPAAADCPAVARLRAAGAAIVGRTNMTEFAYSGVGINPHFGTPANVAMARLDAEPRIPGGSTSGGGVSVACGAAWAALGSDTGGSIRIPAALHGLVGFKNTQRLTPADGTVPLSLTLDTVCAITRSVRDAIVLHEVLADRCVVLAGRSVRSLRLAVAKNVMLDDMDPAVAQAFEAAVRALRDAGASVTELNVPGLEAMAPLQAGGGFSSAESYAWHRGLLATRSSEYDPRVLTRIMRGASIDEAQLRALHAARRDWIATMQTVLAPYDAVLSPTVPLVAPPIAPLLASDDAFFRVNALLLRNTSVVNLLDGCAISLPCHPPGTAPVGLMAWTVGGRDDALLDLALSIETALAPVAGGDR